MQKLRKYLIILLIIISLSFILFNSKKEYLPEENILGVYVNNELSDNYPSKGSALFQKAVCDDASTKVAWDNDNWGLLISNLNKKVKCNLYFYSGQTVFDFDYTGGEQTFVAPVSGTYKVELWGASGGGLDNAVGGLGGYSSGNILLSQKQNLYVFVGQFSSYVDYMCYEYNKNNSFNGNKQGSCSGGGGATDIRLSVSENWYDFNSLKSRIIIAGGGGGALYTGHGGSGGGLKGYDGVGLNSNNNYTIGTGGNQTSGYFGIGGRDTTTGGGGYYGGGHGSSANAGGGSSFISGHNGCDAIKEESTEDNIIHTGQSIHYSGLYFTNTLMIDGEGYRWTDKKEEQIGMPSHLDNSVIIGNSGNGYARITLVSIDE